MSEVMERPVRKSRDQEEKYHAVPGVYAIRHRDGREYIGSTKSLRHRWYQHRWRLRRGEHSNKKLQNSWNKYGEAAFTFVVLDRVPEDRLVLREQELMDERKPHFNLSMVAGRERAGAKNSPEHIAKHRAAISGRRLSQEQKDKLSVALKGRHFSEETRRRISEAKKGHVHSAEARAKMSASHRARFAAKAQLGSEQQDACRDK